MGAPSERGEGPPSDRVQRNKGEASCLSDAFGLPSRVPANATAPRRACRRRALHRPPLRHLPRARAVLRAAPPSACRAARAGRRQPRSSLRRVGGGKASRPRAEQAATGKGRNAACGPHPAPGAAGPRSGVPSRRWQPPRERGARAKPAGASPVERARSRSRLQPSSTLLRNRSTLASQTARL
eukprot:349686-Chlamydomonas_euryale.AAC.15